MPTEAETELATAVAALRRAAVALGSVDPLASDVLECAMRAQFIKARHRADVRERDRLFARRLLQAVLP